MINLTKVNIKSLIIHLFVLALFCNNFIFSQKDSVENFLNGKIITDIKSDGIDLWVATEGNGVYKYNKFKDQWTNFSSDNRKLKQDFFYCIEVSPRFIWAGSADGLYIYDKRRNRWDKRKFSLGGQFGNWIRSLEYDKSENILWIGRFKYLTKYDLTNQKYSDIDLTINKNDQTNTIKHLSLDGDSLLWIGVEAGLHKLLKNAKNSDGNPKIIYYDNNDDYFLGEGKQVSVSRILPDNEFIWFGTDEFITEDNPEFNIGGLFLFDRKINWTKFSELNKLEANGIFSLEKSGKYVWTSIYKFDPKSKELIGQGIFLIDKKNFRIKKINSDFIPDTILSIHFDGNNVWLGSSNGLFKINLVTDFLPDFSKQKT
ncbi:MAG: hypothetical protein IPM32_09845 [Ignavibacteriae bacterium]|nr:hypothetical protein [Ignavibacteriota bacterium]